MQCRWINKKVDLNLLSERVDKFLKSKDFKTKIDKSENSFVITGALKEVDGSSKGVNIKIDGSPNKFLVEFAAGEDKRVLSTLSPIASFLGVGIFVKRRINQMDFYDILEQNFWMFMDETLASLEGSANSAC